MSALIAFNFDPLESLDELKSSGIEERQARAFINLVRKSAYASLENLATKEDLAVTDTKIDTFRAELKQDIALVDTKVDAFKVELKQDMALSETRLENKITDVKGELKQDIAEIKGSVNLLSKLFFGSALLIMVDIAVTLLHHT